MQIGQRLMGGNRNIWTETIIPAIAYYGLDGTSPPLYFADLFYSTHGRWPGSNESVIFRLPASVISRGATHIPGYDYRPSKLNWWLGGSIDGGAAGRWGSPPKQMKIIIDGTIYAAGGAGGFYNYSRTAALFGQDGGSIMSLSSTEAFINASTPLLIEGAGEIFPGGGGGSSCWYDMTSQVYRSKCYGASGVGLPRSSYGGASIPEKPRQYNDSSLTGVLHRQVYNIAWQNTDTGQYAYGGQSGGSGGKGHLSTSSATSGPGAWHLEINSGAGGLVFDLGDNGGTRFPNQASIQAAINLDKFTGKICSMPASQWKASFAIQQNNNFYGWRGLNEYWTYIFANVGLSNFSTIEEPRT